MNSKSNRKRAPATTTEWLLQGEKIEFTISEETPRVSDEELNRRYVKGDVRIVTESARYPLAGILQMLDEADPEDPSGREKRYKLDPEYQRRHRWGVDRKSRLIESFLMNVPVPPVFLYERDLARFEVMDGRQRLTALKDFYANKFSLSGLQYWPELNGRFYSKEPKLPSKVKDGIDRRYISSIVLLKETAATEEEAARLKKIVFERLNSGGVKLSPQETRNAVYNGPLNHLCLELSKNEQFRTMWDLPLEPLSEAEEPDETEERDDDVGRRENAGRKMFQTMADVELVLRFFAYRQIGSFPGGLNKITELLDRFLIEGNKFPASVLRAYRTMFEQTILLVWNVFGSKAFCRLDGRGKPRGRATKIVYDPLMFAASHHSQGPLHSVLVERRDVLLAQLGLMYEKHGELFGGRRTNSVDVAERNARMTEAFSAALKKLGA